MQFNTFVSSQRDIEQCRRAPNLHEVLLEPALLARQGRLTDQQTQTLAAIATDHDLRPVLIWDALMPERSMSRVSAQLTQWDLDRFAAIRVADPGVAYWLKQHLPARPLQLIVETGNHNIEALRGWCEMFSGTLERLILSIELPEEKLAEYCRTLPVACELLGAGTVLLFYSPRSLLAGHLPATETDAQEEATAGLYLQADVSSEEASHRRFPTLETAHGTFMFLDRDQFILDRLDLLSDAGLHNVRLDLRHLSDNGDNSAAGIDEICRQTLQDPVALRKNWPRETRAPFFKTNKTTKSFSKMKSKVAGFRNEDCLAEMVAGENGRYIVLQSLRAFETATARTLILPDGERIDLRGNMVLKDLNGRVTETVGSEQLVIADWIKKAVPGALLMTDSG